MRTNLDESDIFAIWWTCYIFSFSLVIGIVSTALFDRHQDQSIKHYIEESIEVRLGTEVECESADDGLFNNMIIVESCNIKNDSNYPSEKLAYIGRMEIESSNITSEEYTEVNNLVMSGVDINFDIKYFPPSINIHTMLSRPLNFGDPKQKVAHDKEFFIESLQITGIRVSINLPLIAKKVFELDNIELKDLNNENYQEEIRSVIQQRVNSEVTEWLAQNARPFARAIINNLIIQSIDLFITNNL